MKNRRIGGFLTLVFAFFLALAIQALSPVPVKAQEPEGKPFTVTVQLEGGTNSQLIGEYDTFHQAMGVCGQGDLTKQYVIILNRDYTIPRDEAWWSKQDSNIVLKSKGNNQYTLKREGDRGFFTIGNTSKLRLENIILDGNGDGRCCSMFNTSMLTLGKGAVIQNCIDGPVGTDGPAIFVTGESHLYVEEGALVQNNQSATQGGVIQVRNGASLTIINGIFKNNSTSASDGGAIAVYGNLEIDDALFESNQAKKTGGAIIFGSNATGSIKNATFKNNRASTGGAIYGSGKLDISRCIFENNTAKWGGGIFANKGAMIAVTRFKNNTAIMQGGAIYASQPTNINSSGFEGNKATKNGGAIFQKNFLTLIKSNFSQNDSEGSGGALYIDFNGKGSSTISNTSFTGNHASIFGGGIYLALQNKLMIDNAFFAGNEASYGGAIATTAPNANNPVDIQYSNLTIQSNTLFQENTALLGGGIFTAFPTTIELADFFNNHASVDPQDDQSNPHQSGCGGGIYVMDHKTEIQKTTFRENMAYGSGGALSINGGGQIYPGQQPAPIKPNAMVMISRYTHFEDNEVMVGQGGAIYVSPYEYEYKITSAEAYKKLTTDATTLFIGNKTGARLYIPPENYKDFADQLQFAPASDVKHGILEKESLLNNYDVNYKNPYLIIHFDPNGGSGKMKNQLVEFDEKREEPLDYKLPQNGFTPPPGKEFQAWEILDKEYKEGSTYSINKDAVEGKGYLLVKALWKSKPTTPTTPTNPTTPTTPEVIGGEDRVETGEKVSQRFYTHADNVIVVRKDEFPDALTASVLARALDAPILLTTTDHLDAKTAAEIRRLGATKAYIIGKENAIAESTAQEVKKITGKIERIGGSDRYETSSLIAKKVVATIGNTKKAVIATGQDFADALSISPYAAKMGYPILLVKQNQVPSVIQKTIKDLSISGVYVAGGDKAVSKSLDQALPKILVRFDGENRYDTARIIAETLFANSKTAFLASGQVFADALVISPVAAREDGPVLLTRPSVLPAETKAAIDKAHYEKIFVVGLEKAINKTVWEVLR
ncbi:MAG: cell wall-binding repeat-containing protein [Firmicutes bacterium]|nr:cell wall-binding repeat-containing protein [Bacillota bacterium]